MSADWQCDDVDECWLTVWWWLWVLTDSVMIMMSADWRVMMMSDDLSDDDDDEWWLTCDDDDECWLSDDDDEWWLAVRWWWVMTVWWWWVLTDVRRDCIDTSDETRVMRWWESRMSSGGLGKITVKNTYNCDLHKYNNNKHWNTGNFRQNHCKHTHTIATYYSYMVKHLCKMSRDSRKVPSEAKIISKSPNKLKMVLDILENFGHFWYFCVQIHTLKEIDFGDDTAKHSENRTRVIWMSCGAAKNGKFRKSRTKTECTAKPANFLKILLMAYRKYSW